MNNSHQLPTVHKPKVLKGGRRCPPNATKNKDTEFGVADVPAAAHDKQPRKHYKAEFTERLPLAAHHATAKKETTEQKTQNSGLWQPPYTAKKETTSLDRLNGDLQPLTIHSKEGSYKPACTEWRPSAAHRTQ